MANVIAGAAIIVSISGVVVSLMSVKISKNKMQQEYKDKIATKTYVLDKVSRVDTDLCNLSQTFDEHKHNNEREHDILKKDIDKKLDMIIKFMKPDKSA